MIDAGEICYLSHYKNNMQLSFVWVFAFLLWVIFRLSADWMATITTSCDYYAKKKLAHTLLLSEQYCHDGKYTPRMDIAYYSWEEGHELLK